MARSLGAIFNLPEGICFLGQYFFCRFMIFFCACGGGGVFKHFPVGYLHDLICHSSDTNGRLDMYESNLAYNPHII